MAFQFVHFEGFSRQGGKSGRSTDFVFGEALRQPGACPHVGTPQPPELVFGVGVEQVKTRHDERAAAAREVMANGRARAIRKTQQTLATVVASHPYTVREVRDDPAKALAVAEWERLTVSWLREQYGEQLVSVVRHVDERFCHLHAYILPRTSTMKASDLHPGYVAKAMVMSAGPRPGEDLRDLNRRGDLAYRQAMRRWQDSYHRNVGRMCGLARLGPGKRRLSRSEWHAEQCQAAALARAARDAAAAKEVEKKASLRAREAHRELKEVERKTRAARRLMGLSGALRAIWDGVRQSELVKRVHAEVRPIVERWQQAEAAARASAADERTRRVTAEKQCAELRKSVVQLGAQRDELRDRLARYEPVAPTVRSPHP